MVKVLNTLRQWTFSVKKTGRIFKIYKNGKIKISFTKLSDSALIFREYNNIILIIFIKLFAALNFQFFYYFLKLTLNLT